MIIVCPSCDARYNLVQAIDPPGRKVRCRKCTHVWWAQSVAVADLAALDLAVTRAGIRWHLFRSRRRPNSTEHTRPSTGAAWPPALPPIPEPNHHTGSTEQHQSQASPASFASPHDAAATAGIQAMPRECHGQRRHRSRQPPPFRKNHWRQRRKIGKHHGMAKARIASKINSPTQSRSLAPSPANYRQQP